MVHLNGQGLRGDWAGAGAGWAPRTAGLSWQQWVSIGMGWSVHSSASRSKAKLEVPSSVAPHLPWTPASFLPAPDTSEFSPEALLRPPLTYVM